MFIGLRFFILNLGLPFGLLNEVPLQLKASRGPHYPQCVAYQCALYRPVWKELQVKKIRDIVDMFYTGGVETFVSVNYLPWCSSPSGGAQKTGIGTRAGPVLFDFYSKHL